MASRRPPFSAFHLRLLLNELTVNLLLKWTPCHCESVGAQRSDAYSALFSAASITVYLPTDGIPMLNKRYAAT